MARRRGQGLRLLLVVCALCSLPSSLNPAVSCVWLVLLVLSPCGHAVSFVVVRPLMLRIKAGMNQNDSDAGLVLLVMLSSLCFLLLSSDPDVRHLGRYGPEGQVCSTRVWPRSSNAAEAFLAGFAGDGIYTVSLPSLSAGPGCLASWSLWTRWAVLRFLWHMQGSFCWYFTPRAVFLP